jgi:hypothetical protein
MVEKLGHKKRVRIMRHTWIEEAKRKSLYGQKTDDASDGVNTNLSTSLDASEPTTASRIPHRAQTNAPQGPDTDHLYRATPIAASKSSAKGTSSTSLFGDGAPVAGDEPLEDELDALLAENEREETRQEAGQPTAGEMPAQRSPGGDFEDDMEAMAGLW